MCPVLRSDSSPGARDEGPSRLEEAVLSCFPDICPDYLETQAAQHEWDSERLIVHILDEQEKGKQYPKRPSLLKRKRQPQEEEQNDEEELRRKFEKGDPRLASKGRDYVKSYTKAA
jgi:E3 ubiquitin-protein ligase RNF216